MTHTVWRIIDLALRPNRPPETTMKFLRAAVTSLLVLSPLALHAQAGQDSSARDVTTHSLLYGPIHASMRTFAGDTVTVGRGAPMTLVAVFATWCRPCRDEVPMINMLQRDFASKVRVVALSMDEGNEAHIQQWLKQYGATYPVARDASGALARSLRAMGVPAVFLVNSSGHAEWSRTGAMMSSLPELRARLKQLPELAR